jgi:hypothetical protein
VKRNERFRREDGVDGVDGERRVDGVDGELGFI